MVVEAPILERIITDLSVAPVSETETLDSTTSLSPSQGRRNIPRISVARQSCEVERLIKAARQVARERNDGIVDPACVVMTAFEQGILREVDDRFAVLHADEVADATGLPLAPIGPRAKRSTMSPLVAEALCAAQLKAREREQSVVRSSELLDALTEVDSVGSVALIRLRQIGEVRANPLQTIDRAGKSYDSYVTLGSHLYVSDSRRRFLDKI
jgi:hypothetical protein